MKRSLRTQLFQGHVVLFLIASGMSILLTWLELAKPGGPLEKNNGSDWPYVLAAGAVSCVPVVLLGVVSWWLIRRALAPVITLTRAAEHIHEDSLHRRIPVRGTGDEIDRLASVLNDMTSRLDTSFQRVREFTLHASHELKTPLTILRNGFEHSLADPEVPERHRDRLYVWLDEAERLNRIVSGLTLLTQADAHQVTLENETVDLAELVRDAAGEAEILGQSQGLRVSVAADRPVVIRGDRHRLRQLLLNLTDNAVKYNRENGYIQYGLSQENNRVNLSVTSGGRGIDAEELPQIFDRFFRSGTSRGTSTDGCGLGLSIARWIAEEHGGALTAASEPDKTTLTFSLPAPPGTAVNPLSHGRGV